MSYPGPVVSAQWLADNLRAPKLRVVDATVHLPDTGRDARAEYLAEHIRGASFFDLSKIADPNNPLPRKFPPVEVFAREVGALGIDNDTHVVAYDTPGLYSAYCNQGVATLTAASGAGTTSDTLGFASTVFLPAGGSPTRRVFIIAASPVTYACDAANGVLWRISGYARSAAQPTNLSSGTLAGASSRTRLATKVTCPAVVSGSVPPRFSYSAGASERYGLLSAWVTLQDSGESVSLLHQIHVDNTP